MGAWGTGPEQTDDYYDTMSVTIDKAIAAIDRIAARKVTGSSIGTCANDWRAAAVIVKRMADAGLYSDDVLLGTHAEVLRDKLRAVLDDSDWAEEWNSPQEIRKSLRKEIAVLNKLLNTTVARLKRGEGGRGTGIAGRVDAIVKERKKR